MIENFNDVKENPSTKFADSSLGKKAKGLTLDKMVFAADKALEVPCDMSKKYPVENGEWSGERGNLEWLPDVDDVPQEVNPEVIGEGSIEIGDKKETPDETDDSNVEKDNPHQDTIDGVTYYYDDNGDLYRVGNDLTPNSVYEINGYEYKTDEQGRIISVEGKLHLKDREGRLTIKDSIEDIGKGDQKDGDDRGHLIGDQFDGSNGMENMIPQDADINRNDFKNFENELAKAVKDGKDVEVKIELVYEGDSRRPSAIVVTYSINGEESVRIFPNGQED